MERGLRENFCLKLCPLPSWCLSPHPLVLLHSREAVGGVGVWGCLGTGPILPLTGFMTLGKSLYS